MDYLKIGEFPLHDLLAFVCWQVASFYAAVHLTRGVSVFSAALSGTHVHLLLNIEKRKYIFDCSCVQQTTKKRGLFPFGNFCS